MEAAMQSADEVKEEGEAANAVDAGGQTEQTYARLRDTLLVVAAACAVLSLGMPYVLLYLAPRGFDVMPLWLAPPVSALVSFVGAFLCALGCGQGRRLLRHAGVVLGDAVVIALMYVYRPRLTSDGERARVIYAPMWSPPAPKEIMIDGVPVFAVGLLVDQYMLVIIVSSILILLLTRKPVVKTG
jgi:hypothetical protein